MKSPLEGLLRFFAVLVSLWFAHPARGGAILNEVLANFWYPDGYVYDVAEAGGVVYIGGDFHYVGPFTGPSAFLDPVSGARDDSYPQADGAILAAVSDGAGGMFVGGDFATIGGVARSGLAHILPNKTVDPSWAPAVFPGSVSAMNLIGNTLYIAGSFFFIGAADRSGLAAVNASTGILTGWNPHPTSSSLVVFNAMASLGSTVYVAGTFTGIGGQTRTNLAALDAVTGIALAFSPNPNAVPSALLAAGSTVYVGGNFTKIAGQNRTNLAALDATTGNALSWPTDRPNGAVNSLSLSGTTLYLSGFFNALGSVSRASIGALDTISGNATTWNPGSGVVGNPNAGSVFSVASAGSAVFVGGTFTLCGGQPRLRIAALDAVTGNALAGFNPGANDVVRRVIPVGNRVVCSGDFGSIDGAKRNNIAALSATTGAATAWDASTEYYGTVNAIVASSNMVYAGGAFTNIGGQARRIIAALNTTTGAATSWNPNPVLSGGVIYALLLSGDTLYVGGAHGPMGGSLRTNAVALNKTTALATSWNPLPSSVIYTLAQGNGVIYAGGSFKTIGGVARTNLAALDPTSGAATAWNPRCENTVYALAANGNAVYVGGVFGRIAGQNRTNFAALNPSTGNLLSFPNPAYDFSGGGVYALALRGTNSLLVGGAAFVDTDGAGARLVELEVATGNKTSWNAGPDRPGGPFGTTYVRAITVGADKIYVGGEFQGGFAAFGLSGLPPQLVTPARTMSGFQFRLLGTDGQEYIIEATSDFLSWDFVDMVTPVGGFIDVTDPNASPYDLRFYRASVP